MISISLLLFRNETGVQKCGNCLEELEDLQELKIHWINKHYVTQSKTFRFCYNCRAKFEKRQRFEKHIKEDSCHPIKDHTGCPIPICDFKAQNAQDISDHVMLAHFGTPYLCQECPQKYQFWEQLRSHMIQDHFSGGDFICDSCGKSFSEQNSLTRHKKREACVVVTFECDFCEESFTNKQKLRQHLKSHNIHFPEFSVTCDSCGHTFLTQEGMVKHVNRHHAGIFSNSKKEWNFACEKCEKRFVFEEELRTHLKDVHKVRDGETSENHLKCDHCD